MEKTKLEIPDDIYNAADEAYFAAEGDGLTASYEVIAEWARKEALREAEAAIAHITRGYMVRGIQTIRLDDAADAISALAEGGAQ